MNNWSIEDWQWITTPQGASIAARAPLDPTPAQIANLRKKCTQKQLAVAIEYARAKPRIERKFDPRISDRILADSPGVEMASSSAAARYKSTRLAQTLGAGTTILDLCCGIGGDSIELTRAGLNTIGVDHDPLRAWMCAHNAGCDTRCCDILDPELPDAPFHLDPARRSVDGTRSRSIEDLMPCPDIWETLIRDRVDGAIKLHPGVHADELPDGEIEIISESGKLTQAVLWIGALAQTQRRATLLDQSGNILAQLQGAPERPNDETPICTYIHTVDPCVERSDLMRALLDETSLSLVHPGTGLVTSQTLCDHPMTTPFRVVEHMPWHHSRVRDRLVELDAGIVEVKTRGQVIDADKVQRSLRGNGSRTLTLFILPIGGVVMSIVTERIHRSPRLTEDPGGVIEGRPC